MEPAYRRPQFPGYVRRVATLADSPQATTCSAIVGRELGFEIIPVSSFEAGKDEVDCGRADALLVPGAFPDVRVFLMDPSLDLADCFAHNIPALVFAGQGNIHVPVRVHAHPATSPFWSSIPAAIVKAGSNDAAAAAAAADAREACITNEVAARAFNLHIWHELRRSSRMSFHVFTKHSFSNL